MLWQLFFTFFKIGLFTFGGGYAMIAQIREIVVEKLGWMNEDALMQVIVVAESTPGPIAINLATYVGYKRRGVIGAILATFGVVLPSVTIIFLISLFLEAFMRNVYVQYAFVGIKCAVAFLILKAGLTMLKKVERKPLPIIFFCVVLTAMLAFEIFSVSVSTVLLILIGGGVGIFAYVLKRARRDAKAGKGDKT